MTATVTSSEIKRLDAHFGIKNLFILIFDLELFVDLNP